MTVAGSVTLQHVLSPENIAGAQQRHLAIVLCPGIRVKLISTGHLLFGANYVRRFDIRPGRTYRG